MDLTSLKTLKSLLSAHNIHPNKRLGQNFLIDKTALLQLLGAADITKSDTVIEVGAGVGTITAELARRAKKVIAVEKDRALLPVLKKAIAPLKNIEVLYGDILKLPYTLYPIPYTLVGNIPYYLTSPLIRKFLETDNPPQSMTLMVQKEMAERICARPPRMSILAVSVQVYAKPEIIAYVPRSSFWPMPKVDSAILRIVPILAHSKTDLRGFFEVMKAGFSSPRKQLANNLPKKWLRDAGIDSTRRAETLTVEEWKRLWYNIM